MKGQLSILFTLLCIWQIHAQTTLVLPYDASLIIEEQKSSNPDYLAYPASMKIQVKDEVIFECYEPVESLGPFSVSPTKKVMFSPGNLQYCAGSGSHQCADGTTKPGTWRFAEHQWDYVGDAEIGTVYENGVKCDNSKISSTYSGWIDLFGWGTSGWNSGANAYLPYSTSTTYSDYYPGGSASHHLTGAYANADWGVYNQIGSDSPGTWRTLTKDEWFYLFCGRTNAEKLFGLGSVNGIAGVIILPDNWITPINVTFVASASNGLLWNEHKGWYVNDYTTNYLDNTYSKEQWFLMESFGAVFLPAQFNRDRQPITDRGCPCGHYWSSSWSSSSRAYDICCNSYTLSPKFGLYERYYRWGVRLVKDIPYKFSVSTNTQVMFSPGNLQFNAATGTHQCADGTTKPGTWRFAEHQWDIVGMGYGQTNTSNYCYIGGTVTGSDNRQIGISYSGWIDLFGWGTSGWNSGANQYQPYSTSASYSDYYPGGSESNNLTGAYANADWGVYNQIGSDAPGSWRTLTKDEWVYLFQTRSNASSKYGAAKVNGVTGVVLLPDEWTLPDGCGFKAGMTSAGNMYDWSLVPTSNIYAGTQWDLMESAGAVFLPCAGNRLGTSVFRAGTYGYYWSSTANGTDIAYDLCFNSFRLYPQNSSYRILGFSVRLVSEI